jgi:propanol-preferring alcohol dehydrogenase
MKAVRLVGLGKPLELQEVPTPDVGADDVLVRIKAAGICHSDVHYRDGVSPVRPLPITLGHEIAGVIEQAGRQVTSVQVGDRVCLHYLVTCGDCEFCTGGNEQFCTTGQMLGKHRDGGYAEYVVAPARNAVPLPQEIPFTQGAILMCSSATSLHALRKAQFQAGEIVAIFGIGGLGMSAIQLARTFGALDVYAVDLNEERLDLARQYGALPINATEGDPVAQIGQLTNGRGVDVALELIGLPQTIQQALQVLGVSGRAVVVGITDQPVTIDSYHHLIGKEASIMGSDDHLLSELPLLIELTRRGELDLSAVITGTVPLDAGAVNATLDQLARFGSGVRTVITP